MKFFHFYRNNILIKISSVSVSADHCSINNNTSDNNQIIQVHPGQGITVGLNAYNLMVIKPMLYFHQLIKNR